MDPNNPNFRQQFSGFSDDFLTNPEFQLFLHWRRLAADTLQWISCYDEAGRLPEGGSGYNEADRMKSAAKLFHVAQGRNFTFPHAIEMLNKDPKWRPKLRWSMSLKERKAACDAEEEGSAGSGKRSRDDVEDETPTDGFSSGGLQRPEGVKKAKAKRKGKAVATESSSSELSERMKEFATIREREAILKEERIKIEKDKEQRKREELDIHKMKTWFDMVQALKNSPTPLTSEEESYKNFLLGKLQGL